MIEMENSKREAFGFGTFGFAGFEFLSAFVSDLDIRNSDFEKAISKARSTKPETISNDQNTENSKREAFGFGNLDLPFENFVCFCFGFRDSDFEFVSLVVGRRRILEVLLTNISKGRS
jgi:hypothetical protein